jgi:membrane protein DedA with SNARE-associated domain
MNPILILKLLLVGVIIGGIIMYGIGRRNTEKIEIDKEAQIS